MGRNQCGTYGSNFTDAHPQNYRNSSYSNPLYQSQASQSQPRTQYQQGSSYTSHQNQNSYQGQLPQQPQAPPQQSTQDQSIATVLASIMENQAKAAQDQAKAMQENSMILQTQLVTTKALQALNQRMDEMHNHNKMLETQLVQQATSSSKQQGKLPSNLDLHPTEHCNAIFLADEEHAWEEVLEIDDNDEVDEPIIEPPKATPTESGKKAPSKLFLDNPQPYIPPIPFPQRIRKKIEEDESYTLNHDCSALFSSHIPLKRKDLGRFTIPCTIGATCFDNPLADFGASVSVMPLATYHMLGLEGMKATRMTLQLADGTTRYPAGVVENVPLKVDKYYLPCDFVVMDTGSGEDAPLILGRPFLATAGVRINVGSGKLTLKIGGEKVKVQMHREANLMLIEKTHKKGHNGLKGGKNTTNESKKKSPKIHEPNSDPPLNSRGSFVLIDYGPRNVKASTSMNEKQGSLWGSSIKGVACNSSKNPD
ncbi:unnamed protein product [Rhodiola kirilowii]